MYSLTVNLPPLIKRRCSNGAGYHGGFGNTKGSAHNNESANTPKKESRADLISELRKNNIKFSEKDEV